jgi:polar amino acid transport system substrate-binding protein
MIVDNTSMGRNSFCSPPEVVRCNNSGGNGDMLKKLLNIAGAALLALGVGVATPADAQDSTWEMIQSNGVLRVGAAPAPPWFIQRPDGTWGGFGISLGSAAAEALGVEMEVVEVTWGNAVAALQAGQIDMMPVLDPTPQRAAAVAFPATPLLYFSLGVLLRDGAELDNWADLSAGEFRLGLVQGTSIDQFISSTYPDANVQTFPSRQELVAAFQSGRVDGISLYHPALVNMSQSMGTGTVVLPEPYQVSISSVALRQESDQRFRNFLDSSIAFWYANQSVQGWFNEALIEQGVDPAMSPPVQRELLD